MAEPKSAVDASNGDGEQSGDRDEREQQLSPVLLDALQGIRKQQQERHHNRHVSWDPLAVSPPGAADKTVMSDTDVSQVTGPEGLFDTDTDPPKPPSKSRWKALNLKDV